MKKIYSLLTGLLLTASLLLPVQTHAQASQSISYQAVIRNSSNALVVSTLVGMQISVLQGSASGLAVYVETQTTTTNINGLVSIAIGTGSTVTGSFAGIDWATGPYFIKTEIDPTGGTNYSISGTQQTTSLPYGLYIENGVKPGTAAGQMEYWNGSTWLVTEPTLNAISKLQLINGLPTWVPVTVAPTIGTATPGNGQATITYIAPTNNGGSAITSYTATSAPDGLTATVYQAGSGAITVTGLTNGTAYTFTVTATNTQGTSAASAVSNSVTPRTVPGAPTIGTATAGAGQATITYTAPASNGSATITSYTATSSPGGLTGTLSQAGSGTITVSGLTNGTAYTFTVTATNAAGTSVSSAVSNSVTPRTVPGAPTIGSATQGNGQATIAYTAPVSNGGVVITSYTATSSPGGLTGTLSQAGSGTITVTGLTNGTAYTFTVTTTNTQGTSAASAASNSVTPRTIPGAPTIGTATLGAAQATITYTAPASNGGAAITTYTATSSPGGFTGTLSQAGSGTITVSGLTNGTAYTFTVTATNAAGTSAASAVSNSVTPRSVPGAPTIGSATPSNGQATITYTAPVSNGGFAITSYTATSSPGGLTGTLSQAGSGTITVTGLTNGIAYTFTVTATNSFGTSAVSAASNSVTPRTIPGAPTMGTATLGAAQATITYTAPANNGGAAITSYTATSSPGGVTGTLSQAGSGTITVSGLTNGTAYTFTVTATNAAGTSAASAVSNSVTPRSVPGAPTIGIATPGNGQATITYTAPVSNGGVAITSYTATSSPGGLTGSLSQAGSGTITVTGLSNGTAYTFTVTATNSVGTSAVSAASTSVTPRTVPGAPTIGTAAAGGGQATVAFTAPASNGGAAITSYTATSAPGGFTGTLSQAGSGTITVTGLTNGTAYTFRAYATNAGGASVLSAISNSVTPLASVTIGTQVWTNKNLDVTTYSDGTVIPQVTDPTAWSGLTTGAWCYYNNTTANGTTYGKLYNLYAIAGVYDAASSTNPALRKKLAPTGWHIPLSSDWNPIYSFLGGASGGGGKMKSTGITLWTTPNTGADNSSGFTGLPGGFRTEFGTFQDIGRSATWWRPDVITGSTNIDTISGNYMNLNYNSANLTPVGPNDSNCGFSVRLVRD
jgi:uncharacterized protein (TIGR02145 family)